MKRLVEAMKNYDAATESFESLGKLSCEERNKVSNEEYIKILRNVYETKKILRTVREEVLKEITVKYTPRKMYRTWIDKDGNKHMLEYLQL